MARSQWILYCLKDFPILRFTSWVSSSCLHCIQRHKQIYVTVTLFPIKAKQCFACRYKYDKSTSTFVVLQDDPKKEKIISKFTKGRKMTFLCVKEECGKQEIAFIAQFTAFTWFAHASPGVQGRYCGKEKEQNLAFLSSAGKHMPFLSLDWLKSQVAK